jgi:ribosomal protein S10
MKTLNIKIESKNQISVKKFLKFFKEKSNKNFKLLQKIFYKKGKKKFISILKSPHVNKSAQEQFEIIISSAQIKVETSKPLKFLIMLKKMKMNIFPDINIKLSLNFNKKKENLLKQKLFDINNFYIKKLSIKKNELIKFEKIKFNFGNKILNLFDIYGI